MSRKKTPPPADPLQLARQVVDEHEPVRLSDFLEDNAERWEQLVAAVAAESNYALLTEDVRERTHDQVLAALPTKLQTSFSELTNDIETREILTREAAFLVGIEVGRRRAVGGVE